MLQIISLNNAGHGDVNFGRHAITVHNDMLGYMSNIRPRAKVTVSYSLYLKRADFLC
jgi:hypothetical protein